MMNTLQTAVKILNSGCKLAWLLSFLLLMTGCASEGLRESEQVTEPAPLSEPEPMTTPEQPTIEPHQTATAVRPSPIPTFTPILSPTPSPEPTPIPWREQSVIGYSVRERPLEIVRLGEGPRRFVIVGALHGAHECNTYELILHMLDRFDAEPETLPADVTLYLLPLANPDGCVLNTRQNANGVDLNRNWDTPDWQTNAEGPTGPIPGSGGPHPFSEPETAALRDWLMALRAQNQDEPISIISYHSAVPTQGAVLPGNKWPEQLDPASVELAMAYAAATGYPYSSVWVGAYEITGEFIYWANANGFTAVDVELADRGPADSTPANWSETHVDTNWRGLLTVLRNGD